MQYSKFVVNERPFCVWDWDLRRSNLSFIDNIDPSYFDYLADIHGRAFEVEDQRQAAALALRTAYAHGLETLMATAFAALQAPDCVVGWLHKYATHELITLVRKFENRQRIWSKLIFEPFTWEGFSNATLAIRLEDKDREAQIKQHFGKAWQHFAEDFLHESNYLEYNSVKHGFRLKTGGFNLAVAPVESPDVEVPAERMQSLGGSDFGSSCFIPEWIGDSKVHFRVKAFHCNWQPEKFIHGLRLISITLDNLLSFLRLANGVPKVQFHCPQEDSLFEEPWKVHPGVTSVCMDFGITEASIKPFTKEEILDVYKPADPGVPPPTQ
jgi:hypothetical protein